ncbi:MAG: putative secreted protein, partial [Labilithrix sp.]|nr:putative secreted protein [Labilithrix sp.]
TTGGQRAWWTIRRWVVATVAILAMVVPREARAEDVTGAAYNEARAIIDDLITQEFAESATVWLTCKTGYLPRYYVRSLRRLKDRQWGELKTALRDDSINLATDALYVAARQRVKGVKEQQTSVRDFIQCRGAGRPECVAPSDTKTSGTIAQTLRIKHDDKDKDMSLKDVCVNALQPANPDQRMYRAAILAMIDGETETAPNNVFAKELKPQVDGCAINTDDPACALVNALKAALQNKPAVVEGELMTFVTTAFLTDDTLPDHARLRETTRDLLLEWLRQNKNGRGPSSASRQIVEAVRGMNPDDEMCKQSLGSDIGAALVELASADATKPETLSKLACLATSDLGTKLSIEIARKASSTSFEHKIPFDELVTRFGRRSRVDEWDDGPLPENRGRAPIDERLVAEHIACRALSAQATPFVDCSASLPKADALDGAVLMFAGTRWTVSLKGAAISLVPALGPSSKSLPSPTLTALITTADQVRVTRQILESRVSALFGGSEEGLPEEKLRKLTTVALRIEALQRDLRELRLVSEGEHLDTSSLFGATLRIVGESAKLCGGTEPPAPKAGNETPTDGMAKPEDKEAVDPRKGDAKSPGRGATEPQLPKAAGKPSVAKTEACKKILALRDYIQDHNDEIDNIVAAAERRDYKTVALDTLRLALPAGADEDSPSTCSIDSPSYRRLTLSFASYILSENGGSSDKEISRETLRSAAVDALRCMSTSGLDRSAATTGQAAVHTLFRDVALRASWNQAYRNQSGPDGYRTLISASAFTWHERFTSKSSSVYVGSELSAVDWLAPLTELALRRADASYSNEEEILLGFVRPRADIVVGLPVLTEHLAASLGGSILLAAPYRGKPGESPSGLTDKEFTYLPIWSSDARVQESRAPFLEFNLGVHYVF